MTPSKARKINENYKKTFLILFLKYISVYEENIFKVHIFFVL